MAPVPGAGVMDGGWWPRSRELAHELGELVDHLPVEHGRVVRASFSPPDWDTASRGIPTAPGAITATSSPQDDPHLILLTLADRRTLQLLVVPPALSQEQGEEALLAAATPGYAHSARCLLSTVTNSRIMTRRITGSMPVEAGAAEPAQTTTDRHPTMARSFSVEPA